MIVDKNKAKISNCDDNRLGENVFAFEKLKVYELALAFSKQLYEVTEDFPAKEKFGLVSQIRRAGVSVLANIAEGSGRYHKKDFQQFIRISRSSIYECVSLLRLSKELSFIKVERYDILYSMSNRLARMLNSLINSLEEAGK